MSWIKAKTKKPKKNGVYKCRAGHRSAPAYTAEFELQFKDGCFLSEDGTDIVNLEWYDEKSVSIGSFHLINNREKIPVVISNRHDSIEQILLTSKSTTTALRKLIALFEKTKVQIGEYWTPNGRKRHLFIRNGIKGKAHLLIERI
jgi:hypothetical protein